ncbi:hypothetical protein AXW83_19060 [Bosea sp. PAMC 26642]|nr:hypothetical protein AXW83_19060 [Bosea sp. PAMC 26642]
MDHGKDFDATIADTVGKNIRGAGYDKFTAFINTAKPALMRVFSKQSACRPQAAHLVQCGRGTERAQIIGDFIKFGSSPRGPYALHRPASINA